MRFTIPATAQLVAGDPTRSINGPPVCDLWPGRKIPPAGWAVVRATPLHGPSGPASDVTPDAWGRLLHFLVSFAHPREHEGKRCEWVPGYAPEGYSSQVEVELESDQGLIWIGSDASIELLGGTPGDTYELTAHAWEPRNETRPSRAIDVYEDPFVPTLTSWFSTEDVDHVPTPPVPFPGCPIGHTHFYVIEGQAQIQFATFNALVPLGNNPGRQNMVPYPGPGLKVSTGAYATTIGYHK